MTLSGAGVSAMRLAWSAAPIHVTGYVLLAVLSGLAPLGVAWPTKLLLDQLASGTVWGGEVIGLAALIALVGVLAALLPQVTQYLRAEIDRRVQLVATTQLYQAVDRLVGLPRFEDPVFLDRLQLSRSSGVMAPGQCVEGALGSLQAVVTVGGFAVALVALQPWAAVVVVLGTVPVVFAELALSRRRAAVLAATAQAERRELFYSGLLVDAHAAQELRLFGAGPFLWRRMAAEMRTINRSYRRIDRRTLGMQSGLALLGAVVAGGLLLWTVRAVTTGTLTVGDVVLVVAAVGSVQTALASLVTQAVSIHQAALLFRGFLDVIHTPPDLPVRSDPIPTVPLRHGIELRDVWFRYAEDQPWVLRGVDLLLPANRTTAVVGLNGAGKTTLIKLLCRLYDPTRGAVCWDGTDLRDLDPRELRSRIRAVFQDATDYDLTAAENIAIGDLNAIDDQTKIEEAAERAGAHELISRLPSGYDTLLTRIFFSSDAERSDPATGITLSGGQWQRIALARGLVLEDSDLLVLDEPSSALDAEAEHEVHARLRAQRAGRATLLVSHRLGIVREADLIVVLADGQIAESGNHRELVERDGVYAHLFTLQAAGYRQILTDEEVA